jgi:hypothetical protein
MPKYKPMLIHFDDDGYNQAVKKAEEKINIFHQALILARKDVVVDNLEDFSRSFTSYYKKAYYQSNKEKIQLDISVDKLLYLMEVDLTRLERLERNFNLNTAPIDFINQLPDDEEVLPIHRVDKKDYELYTTSSEQNEILRAGRNLIDAIQTASNYATIYPFNIGQATGNLIRYDIRKAKYFVNISGIR